MIQPISYKEFLENKPIRQYYSEKMLFEMYKGYCEAITSDWFQDNFYNLLLMDDKFLLKQLGRKFQVESEVVELIRSQIQGYIVEN